MAMPIFHRFCDDESGSSHEALVITAAVIAAASFLGAHFFEQMSRPGGLPRIAIISPDGRATTFGGAADNRFGDIDYSTTGSLPQSRSRPIILDPCTGQSK